MNKKLSIKMNKAKERIRLNSPLPNYPIILPERRIKITIELFDFGHEIYIFELFKTNNIRQFKVYINNKLWKWKIGLSKILIAIRKSILRSIVITNQVD